MIYSGGTPGTDVVRTTYRYANDQVTTSVSNLKIVNDVAIARIVGAGKSGTSVKNTGATLENVHVDLCDYLLNVDGTDSTVPIFLTLKNCSGDMGNSAVRLSNDIIANVNLSGLDNLGTAVDPVFAVNGAASTTTVSGCNNLGDDQQIISKIVNSSGGVISSQNVSITDASTHTFSAIGNLNRAFHILRDDGARNGHSLFNSDSSQLNSVALGSDMTVNSQGNAGTINAYISSGVLNIENLAGSTKDLILVSFYAE